MARDPKPAQADGERRPISEGIVNRGGINDNPSALLSRPAPPQPYRPADADNAGSSSKGRSQPPPAPLKASRAAPRSAAGPRAASGSS